MTNEYPENRLAGQAAGNTIQGAGNMAEEGKISVNQFTTVVVNFQSQIRGVVENMNRRFDQMGAQISVLQQDMHSVKEQITLLHVGQTEIKAELRTGLKDRVTYQDFNQLEKRVARLERKQG